MVTASVFAWEQATGSSTPAGLCVCHTCDQPACVRNDDSGIYVVRGRAYERHGHLWLGTIAANSWDAFDKGRWHSWPRSVGEQHGTSKLTTAQVLEIRERSRNGATYAAIAADLGVSQSTVGLIVIRKTWRHVE
jgi:hypothetical protein